MTEPDERTKAVRMALMQERREIAQASAAAERRLARAQAIPPERLEAVEITGVGPTGKPVTLGVAMRRQSEARLWASFTPDQERAALRIGAAFIVIERGVGLQESMLARAMRGDGSGGSGLSSKALIDDYFAWGRECTRRRISHAAIMDVLGYGKSCRQVERDRRRRNGWMREELGLGLDLYADLKGW